MNWNNLLEVEEGGWSLFFRRTKSEEQSGNSDESFEKKKMAHVFFFLKIYILEVCELVIK